MNHYQELHAQLSENIQKTKSSLTCIMLSLDRLEEHTLYFALQNLEDQLSELTGMVEILERH